MPSWKYLPSHYCVAVFTRWEACPVRRTCMNKSVSSQHHRQLRAVGDTQFGKDRIHLHFYRGLGLAKAGCDLRIRQSFAGQEGNVPLAARKAREKWQGGTLASFHHCSVAGLGLGFARWHQFAQMHQKMNPAWPGIVTVGCFHM